MENTFKGTQGEFSASKQKGTPGHCFQAQVFCDGKSIAYFEPTEDEAEASANAQLMIHALPMLRELMKEVEILESMGLGDTERCTRKKQLIKSATKIK